MTNVTVSAIVHSSAGGRPLLRSADSVDRQQFHGVELLIARSGAPDAPPPLVGSISSRTGATVAVGDSRPASINAAARSASGEVLVVVPEGYELVRGALDRIVRTIRATGAEAVAPAVLLRTPDGIDTSCWLPTALDAASALADPRGAPPILIVRRSIWRDLAGLDESFPELAACEFWLRLLFAGCRVHVAAEPLVSREVSGGEADAVDETSYLAEFRSIVSKHRAPVERSMAEVLASREVHFGTLRARHADLVRARDAGLAELDRVRADIAHRRAYIAHHGGAALDWGEWRRPDPVSRDWGYDRGVPIDRRHIEDFLAARSSDIRGAVLEVQEDDYTRRFGGVRVAASDVLDVDAANGRATIVADLRAAPGLAPDRFDCIILTQTLHVIDDMDAAIRECHRVLKPGGVLVATLPAASRVCLEYGDAGDFWRATPAGARALVERTFAGAVDVTSYGNVLTNVAFLEGLACDDLTDAELAAADPYFPALVGIRARKGGSQATAPRGVVLLYHRVDDRADVHDLSVPADRFQAHLDWLTSRCDVIALDELLGSPPESLPARAVALTFDDGYVDNLTVAAPLLARQKVPATFLLTSRWLHEPGEYWWDALERMLLGNADTPAYVELAIEGMPRRIPTSTAAERASAHAVLHPALVHASLDVRERAIAALRAWSGGSAARVRPMSAAEVRALAAMAGVRIGAHTVNHLALPDQPEAVRAREVIECAAELAEVIQRPVDLLAYPYGAVDRATADHARQSCRWSLTCEPGPVAESFDAARVPRLDVKPWTVDELASRIEGCFAPAAARRAFSLPR